MHQGKTQTDSQEGKLKVGPLALLAGAAAFAVAVLLISLAAGSTGVQAQEAGTSYGGTVNVLVAGTCGGGSITVTVGADGASITQLTFDGTYVGGVLVNGLSVPPGGPFVIALPTPIAIAAGGSFNQTIQPVPGVDAIIQGQFTGTTVTGTFGVTALACVNVPFSAEAGVVPPTSTPAPAAAPTAAAVLPKTGGGPGGSADSTSLWFALAAAAGAVMLAGGLALRRRA
jgi:hypothetical protein